MTELILDCPYCDLKAGFKFVVEDPVTVPLDTRDKWTTLYICRNCGEAVIVRLKSPGPKPSSCPADPRRSNFKIEAVYPKPQKITALDYTPEEIKQDYKGGDGQLATQKLGEPPG